MRNTLIKHHADSGQFTMQDINSLKMNSTNLYAFCHCLYSYMMDDSFQNEILELFNKASVHINNSILLKHKRVNDSRKPRREDLFEKFICDLKQYCSTEHHVQFYADKLFISPHYLSELSKDVSGRTASIWINEFIILEAKTLLIHTNLSIQEIAFDMGFSDQSSFGKFFKKNVGVSPKRFAQNIVDETFE